MWPGQHAREQPDKLAFVMAGSGEAVTYRELNDRSNQVAQLFWDAGLRFGDHIAVLMDNRPEYFEVCWAAQRSGLFYTCINWHFTAEEAAYILDDCDAQVLVISDAYRELAAELADQMPHVRIRLDGRRRARRRLRAVRRHPRPLSRPSRSRRSSRARRCSTRRAPPGGRRASSTTSPRRRSATCPAR